MGFFVQYAGMDFWSGAQIGDLERVRNVLSEDFQWEFDFGYKSIVLSKADLMGKVEASALSVDAVKENHFKYRFLKNARDEEVYCIEYQETVVAVDDQDERKNVPISSRGVQVWSWVLEADYAAQKTKAVFTRLVIYGDRTIADLKKEGRLTSMKSREEIEEKAARRALQTPESSACSIQ